MSMSLPNDAAFADIYQRNGERLTQPIGLMALDRLGDLRGRRLIDVAAGTGGLAVAAAERGAEVLVSDINPALTARAAERLRGHPGCETLIASFDALGRPTDAYDAAISSFGILAYQNWHDGLQEMGRVTRPGGMIALTMWTHVGVSSPAHLLKRVFARTFRGRELWPQDAFPLFSRESIAREVETLGFVRVKAEVVSASWSPHSSVNAVDECMPMFASFPTFAALPTGEADLLREPLRRAFDDYADADGTIRLPIEAFLVTAAVPDRAPARETTVA